METREFGEFLMLLSKLPEGAGVDPELLKHYTNTRIEEIVKSFPWTRLQKTSTFQTVAKYDTGTVSIASGATAGTGVGTLFTSGMTGRRIRINNTAAFYTFTFVGAGNFTIDRPYEDPTNAVNAAFVIWQAIFGLPNDLERLKSLELNFVSSPAEDVITTIGSRGRDLDEQSREWLNRRDPARIFLADPEVYVQAPDDPTTGLPRVELYPGPINLRGVYIEYDAKVLPLVETSDLFPEWFSIPCMWAGVVSDLNGRPVDKEALFVGELARMQAEDTRRKPVLEIQMADRFIEHRIRRANRNWRGRWGTIPW